MFFCQNMGISSEDFIENFQGKKPLIFKKAFENTSSFNWSYINSIFDKSNHLSPDFKLLYDGVRRKDEYVESYYDVGELRHRLIKPALYDFLRKGATLIANKITKDDLVGLVASEISRFTQRQVVSSAYLSFGEKDSFRSHWDTRDIFAIQIVGRKRWIIYEPTFDEPLFTQQSKDLEEKYPHSQEPFMDFVLEEGDILYLPKGWWHNPLPLGEPTFHLSIGTFPPLSIDFIQWVLSRMSDYPVVRKSLRCWDHDKDNLIKISDSVKGLITSRDSYEAFMNDYFLSLRSESGIASEIFGNSIFQCIEKNHRLILSSINYFGLDSGYIIANGVKVNVDSTSAN